MGLPPNWNDLSDQEKIEYLRRTCENLEQRIQQQGAWMNGLQDRISTLEVKAGG